MNSLDLTLLVVAGLLALILTFVRLQHRLLWTGSSGVGTGLKLAGGAALTFWLTFILGGSVVWIAANAMALGGSCGGPEWGGCLGPFVIVVAVVASTVLGVVAALSHGVAVFLLRRTFAVMISSHRVASSTLTALAVLVVVFFFFRVVVGLPVEAGWPLLIFVGPLPFVLSILVVPAVSRLQSAHGDDGAA